MTRRDQHNYAAPIVRLISSANMLQRNFGVYIYIHTYLCICSSMYISRTANLLVPQSINDNRPIGQSQHDAVVYKFDLVSDP